MRIDIPRRNNNPNDDFDLHRCDCDLCVKYLHYKEFNNMWNNTDPEKYGYCHASMAAEVVKKINNSGDSKKIATVNHWFTRKQYPYHFGGNKYHDDDCDDDNCNCEPPNLTDFKVGITPCECVEKYGGGGTGILFNP